jgi:hypothetical protein
VKSSKSNPDLVLFEPIELLLVRWRKSFGDGLQGQNPGAELINARKVCRLAGKAVN